MYIALDWFNEKEPKHVATIDTTLNKIVVLDGNFVYNSLRNNWYISCMIRLLASTRVGVELDQFHSNYIDTILC
jgi:hypothetical protein